MAQAQNNRIVYHADAELLGVHICSELCWCNPIEEEPGLWFHYDHLVEGSA